MKVGAVTPLAVVITPLVYVKGYPFTHKRGNLGGIPMALHAALNRKSHLAATTLMEWAKREKFLRSLRPLLP
jgi:hypothetical protein